MFAVVLGSAMTTAAMLLVVGIGKNPVRSTAPDVVAASEGGDVAARAGNGKIEDRVNGRLSLLHGVKRGDSSVFFEPPRLAARNRVPDGGGDALALDGGSTMTLGGLTEATATKAVATDDDDDLPVAERYAAFKSSVVSGYSSITSASLSEKTRSLVVDVKAEGGLFEPQIDNDMQLNARRVLRAAVLRKMVPDPIRTIVVRYAVNGKKSALSITWSADDLMGFDWTTATFPQMMDIGHLTALKGPARDMVRNYCRVEGAPKGPLCTSAYRHKLLK